MADAGQVHADLVRASSLQCTFEQGGMGETLQHMVVRARRPAAADNGHLRALHRMASDRRIDDTIACNAAMRQRQVVALHRARLQLAHEVGLRFEGLGDDEQATGVLVEPVHDAGARYAGKLWCMVQERVEQRALPVAASRMHDQPGRLVDDKDVRVLVRDSQGNVLRRLRCVIGQGPGVQRDAFAAPDLALGIPRRIVDADFSLFHPGGESAARMLRQQARERLIEAQPGTIRGYLQNARRVG